MKRILLVMAVLILIPVGVKVRAQEIDSSGVMPGYVLNDILTLTVQTGVDTVWLDSCIEVPGEQVGEQKLRWGARMQRDAWGEWVQTEAAVPCNCPEGTRPVMSAWINASLPESQWYTCHKIDTQCFKLVPHYEPIEYDPDSSQVGSAAIVDSVVPFMWSKCYRGDEPVEQKNDHRAVRP